MTRWHVYAGIVGGRFEYIGMAEKLGHRRSYHASHTFHGEDFEFRVLRTTRSRERALKLEAELIAKHQPPRNVQQRGRRKGHCTLVDTLRPNGLGGMVSVTVRLRPGDMGLEEARSVWSNPKHKSIGAALAHMPGWSRTRAVNIFGPR